MAHFCGFIKLIFLLLILAQIPFREMRPLKSATSVSNSGDLIVGNEFLQLFLEGDNLQKELYSNGHFGPKSSSASGSSSTNTSANSSSSSSSSRSSSSSSSSSDGQGTRRVRQPVDDLLQEERSLNSRSLRDKASKSHQALVPSLKEHHPHQQHHQEQQPQQQQGAMTRREKEEEVIGADSNKQVVKLVTTGSKIIFLEDYDNDDAIIDAEARDIDLQREYPINKKKIVKYNATRAAPTTTNLDDFKVVAVSVSTSSQHNRTPIAKIQDRLNHNVVIATDKKHMMTIGNQSSMGLTAHTSPSSSPGKIDVTGADNYINRSHKSELSIEEIEPFSHNEHRTRRPVRILQRQHNINGQNAKSNRMDSEHSASTNVRKVLVIPRSLTKNSYSNNNSNSNSNSNTNSNTNSNSRNVTTNNHNKINNRTIKSNKSKISDADNASTATGEAITVEDQLLPFETVIYHDTKEGHGPQSRSISYSSISQNVQDLQKWQQTGVLAEARRNVSESLKAVARQSNNASPLPSDQQQQAEAPTHYSQPSKMYSVPAKFYSEPAKVYSEPSKVYGEPEKFYSEPAKNYGEPSKFYSEPSKVYSQPAKVYSEPAKTYWPPSPAPASASSSANKASSGSSLPTTAAASSPSSSLSVNRKPAIVSRIAFGEAQNHGPSSTTSTTIRPATTATLTKVISTTVKPPNAYQHQRNYSHSNSNNNRQRHYPSGNGGGNSSGNSSPASTPRRILFNLDKLPYDLLNAPEPTNVQQQQQQQQQQRSPINPCLDAAVSTLFSTSSLSAHLGDQQQQQQQSQHQQQQQHHSNQNAKGLLNEDLVKCVAEISHTASTSIPSDTLTYFTTERTQNEDYYTPTPEQNYEIEEAVSVMTNGRAHGAQRVNAQFNNGNSDRVVVTATTSSPSSSRHSFKPMRQRVRFGTNIKPVDDDNDDGSDATIATGRGTTAHHQQQQKHAAGSGRRGHLTQSYDITTNAKVNIAHSNSPLIQTHHNHNHNHNHNNDDDGSVVIVNHNLGIPSENYDDYDVDIVEGNAGDGDGAIFKTNHNYPTAAVVHHHHRGASNSDGGGELGQLLNTPYNLHHDGGDDGGGDGNGNGDDDAKVAYVVEGRNYRKYRVEEKTDDGFIVGEYGVVDHNDGNLRGVRYTADSTINRSLIQKALLTFLKLK